MLVRNDAGVDRLRCQAGGAHALRNGACAESCIHADSHSADIDYERVAATPAAEDGDSYHSAVPPNACAAASTARWPSSSAQLRRFITRAATSRNLSSENCSYGGASPPANA